MKVKKILHVTGVRNLGSGQRNQLVYESNSAKEIKNIEWKTLALHSGEIKESFERGIPKYLDFILIRNAFFWIIVFKLRKKYDLILFRHLTFDPFTFIFSPLIKNRVGVHHSKEIEELKLIRKGLKGRLASFIERITGKFSVKNSLYIAGVTEEIALYERDERKAKKPIIVYPNGIEIKNIKLLKDNRDDSINILFICSHFAEWHGLDILLNSLNEYEGEKSFFIHLIGNLTDTQKIMISNNKYLKKIIIHGAMSVDEYYTIASKCDVGLGSLAMYRQNLKEGSTLKVREMLAMGLPVYSGHRDASLDTSFKYYKYSNTFIFDDLLRYADNFKLNTRLDVRKCAEKFIDKKNIMQKFIADIENI